MQLPSVDSRGRPLSSEQQTKLRQTLRGTLKSKEDASDDINTIANNNNSMDCASASVNDRTPPKSKLAAALSELSQCDQYSIQWERTEKNPSINREHLASKSKLRQFNDNLIEKKKHDDAIKGSSDWLVLQYQNRLKKQRNAAAATSSTISNHQQEEPTSIFRNSTDDNQDYSNSNTAVFIDAQNASAPAYSHIEHHIQNVLLSQEAPTISSSSLPAFKRIFGENYAWDKNMGKYNLASPYKQYSTSMNVDSLLVMDVMETLYEQPHMHTYIIISTDTDFIPLVRKLQQHGKIVVVYGHSVMSKLGKVCDYYFDYKLFERERERGVQQRQLRLRKEVQHDCETKSTVRRDKKWSKNGIRQQPGYNQSFHSKWSDFVDNLVSNLPKEGDDESYEDVASEGDEEKRKEPMFTSFARTNPHLLHGPRNFLQLAYAECGEKHQVELRRETWDSAFTIKSKNERGEMWYTATLTDPITHEQFLSGLVQKVNVDHRPGKIATVTHVAIRSGPPLHQAESNIMDGRVWYRNKKLAEHAAAARAIDCYIFRESEEEKNVNSKSGVAGDVEDEFRLCHEEPHPRGDKEDVFSQQEVVDYDFILRQRFKKFHSMKDENQIYNVKCASFYYSFVGKT